MHIGAFLVDKEETPIGKKGKRVDSIQYCYYPMPKIFWVKIGGKKKIVFQNI